MIRFDRTGMELFGLTIHWYGVLIVLGMALAVGLAWKREEKKGLPKETTLDLALVGIPAAIVGARIYFVIFKWDEYAGQPWWKLLAVWEGGLAIYGGIIGGVLAGWIYSRAKKLPFVNMLDLVAPCFPLGQAIGRWGNFINQEAHGALVENAALCFFPAAVKINGAWYYATFFYESAWCFLIVIVLLILERRDFFKKTGDEFAAYVFLYALERGVVEGLRTDSLYLGGMRVSQGLSLLAALAVTLYLAQRCRKPWRVIAPLCVLATIISALAGSLPGTFAASAAALAATAVMYIPSKSKIEAKEQ